MIAEEINQMEAGRELDALVAEKVMGWKRSGSRRDPLWRTPEPDMLYAHHPPPYSTDIAAAWLVVEKLTSTTKQWLYLSQHSNATEAVFETIGAGPDDAMFVGDAEDAPLAICRAALKAVLS